MTTMRFVEVDNIHGETYNLVVRKHSEAEISHVYGFPYSIRISNANPDAFDLNTTIILYDDWQTAYKRLRELAKEYRTVKPRIWRDVDARTGRCREVEA